MWQNTSVKTTLDIPASLYRQLKSKAARERVSVKQLIVRRLRAELLQKSKKRSRRVVLPVVRSKRPGSLEIDNDRISELLLFP
jgi:hypothetical protein